MSVAFSILSSHDENVRACFLSEHRVTSCILWHENEYGRKTSEAILVSLQDANMRPSSWPRMQFANNPTQRRRLHIIFVAKMAHATHELFKNNTRNNVITAPAFEEAIFTVSCQHNHQLLADF